jgi:hypothetical protein
MSVRIHIGQQSQGAQMVSRVANGLGSIPQDTKVVMPILQWRVLSSNVPIDTPCARCRRIIPARFMRARATTTIMGSDVHQYIHMTKACIGNHLPVVGRALGACNTQELSEQERRVAERICAL